MDDMNYSDDSEKLLKLIDFHVNLDRADDYYELVRIVNRALQSVDTKVRRECAEMANKLNKETARKPTIAELEAILDSEPSKIRILPDGSITGGRATGEEISQRILATIKEPHADHEEG